MGDKELIKAVAKVWVDGGGDAEGITWCWRRIKDAVDDEIQERKEEGE